MVKKRIDYFQKILMHNKAGQRTMHRLVVRTSLVLAFALSSAGISAADHDVWNIWNLVYESRPESVMQSGRVGYLRRVVRAGEEPRISLETCTVQGGRLLARTQEYEVASGTPLDSVNLQAFTRSTDYFWDGQRSVTISALSGEDPEVTITATSIGIPRMFEYGRGSNGMAAPNAWRKSLEAMGKRMSVTDEQIQGRNVLVVRVGRDGDPGFFLYMVLDPALGHAVRHLITKLDDAVFSDEEFSDFVLIDSLYIPRRGFRRSFRLQGDGELTEEEFLWVGPASFNQQYSASELSRPIPPGANIWDTTASPTQ